MDRAITILILLVGVAVAGVLIAPSFVDWNQYRDEIEAYAEQSLNRDVEINGDVGFQLFPSPALTIANLTIANGAEADSGTMLGLQKMELKAALRPLLMGDIQITDVLLVKPNIALEVLAGNQTNWTFEGAGFDAPPVNFPSWLSAVVRALRFDNITIRDGTLTYLDPGRGVRQPVENLNGTISARTIDGPFAAQGKATFRGVDVNFDLSIADMSRVRAVPARLSIIFQRSLGEIAFRGVLQEASLFGPISGDLSFAGSDAALGLNDLFALIRGTPVAAPKGVAAKALGNDFRAEATFFMDGRSLAAEDLTVGLGEVRAKGTLSGTMGRTPTFDLKLATRSFNLDALLEQKPATTTGVNLDKAAENIESELEGFLVPTNLIGTMDIAVDGVIYRAGVIQNFAVKARAENGSIIVESASGQLPGRGKVESSGLWMPTRGGTVYAGALTLEAGTPFALLRWAGFDMSGIAADRLNELNLTADVTLAPDRWALEDADLVLDGRRHRGTVASERGGSPAFRLALTSDALDLDAYAGLLRLPERPAPWDFLFPGDTVPRDLDLDVTLGRLTWGGDRFSDVTAVLRRDGDGLSISRLAIGNWDGVSLAVSGRVRGTLAAPDLVIDATATADQLVRLLALAGVAPGTVPVVGGRSSVSVRGALAPAAGSVAVSAETVNGAGDAVMLAGTISLDADGYRFTIANAAGTYGTVRLDGVAAARDDGLQGEVQLTAAAPDLSRFLLAYGVAYVPADGALGALDLTGTVTLAGPVITTPGLTFKAGRATAALEGTLDVSGDRPRMAATLDLAFADLDGFLPAADTAISAELETGADLAALQDVLQEPAPGGDGPSWYAGVDGNLAVSGQGVGLRGATVDDLAATLVFSEGVIASSDLTGAVFGGQLAADLSYPAGDLLPELTGTVELANAEWALATQWLFGLPDASAPLDGRATLTASLSALGRSWMALTSTLNGTLTVAAGDGTVRGLDLAAFRSGLNQVASLAAYRDMAEATMSAGATPFSSLYGTVLMEDGRLVSPGASGEPLLAVLTDGAGLDADSAGTLSLTGEIDLTTRLVNGEGTLALADYQDAPPVVVRLTGPLTDPRRQIESSRFGATLVDAIAARAEDVTKDETQRQIDAIRDAMDRLDESANP